MAISLVIYEDNARLRGRWSYYWHGWGIYYCGAFSDCTMVTKQMESLVPDMVIMDIDSRMSGIEGVRELKQLFPTSRYHVYIFDDNRIFDCICNGRWVYVKEYIAVKTHTSLKN